LAGEPRQTLPKPGEPDTDHPRAAMPKNIIVCTDGTWDNASEDTNVVKLSRMLLSGAQQVVSYDDGVGADGTPLEKLTGGAFGDGLLQKVKNGYAQVAQVYEAGDNIFLFGFSRGAYTARSIAGMIATCGLPTGGFDDNFLATVFTAYRNPAQRAALLAGVANYNLYDAKITMVGVWDTVGSLGIPALFGGVEASCQFLDTSLHPDVTNAYQAIAVDERREEFPPTLWRVPSPPNPGQTLVQIYFAGVHCDVGGGYPEADLSDITLGWMLANAQALGALFNQSALSQYVSIPAETALGLKHESWSALWAFPRTRTIDPAAALGNSVGIRYQADPTYRPANLNGNGVALSSTYGSVRVVNDPPVPSLGP
jgi:uncharacterized protein (DUF2235 family)